MTRADRITFFEYVIMNVSMLSALADRDILHRSISGFSRHTTTPFTHPMPANFGGAIWPMPTTTAAIGRPEIATAAARTFST